MVCRLMIAAMISVLLVACGSSGSSLSELSGTQQDDIAASKQEESGYTVGFPPVTGYLPYVESVRYPEHIAAGESFSITADISSQSLPEVLNGCLDYYEEDVCFNYTSEEDEETGILTIRCTTWFWNPDFTGEFANILEFNVPALEEGTYRLQIRSAESSDWGGYMYIFRNAEPLWPLREHEILLEYMITVEPPGGVQD